MKRFIPLIILILLLGVAAGVIYGFVHTKRKRDAEMNEFYLCETHFDKEQYESAALLLDEFLQSHPKSQKAEDAYYHLAISREKLGDSSLAMTAWNKIIEGYPESSKLAQAYYHLGAGYRSLGEYDKAMENYKIVVDRYPNMPLAAGAWYGIGQLYEAKEQDAMAVGAYRKALEKNPVAEFIAEAERKWGNINLKRYFSDSAKAYQIKRGDSLVKIAARFNITPERLMKLNGLTSHMLQTGQIIRVVNADFNVLVDLSQYKLFLMSGDAVIKRYPICIGKAETPTPTGEYKVTEKLPNPVWFSTLPSGAKEAITPGDPRNELGTRWIGFKPAYGVHGTIEPASIGKALSKGCVRMLNEDVEELYDLMVVGMPVKLIPGAK